MTARPASAVRAVAYLTAPVAISLVLFVAPLAMLALDSLRAGGSGGTARASWTLVHYARFFGDAYYLSALGVTLGTGLLVTLLTTVLSFPLAWTYWRATGRLRSLLVVLVLSPFYANVVVKVFGWMALLSPSGVLNSLLL